MTETRTENGNGGHTPTPWSLHLHTGSLDGEAHINGPHNCAICYVGFGTQTDDHYVRGEEAKANAAFIIRSVNSHDALVEALERLSALTPSHANARSANDLHMTVKAIADTALALARST